MYVTIDNSTICLIFYLFGVSTLIRNEKKSKKKPRFNRNVYNCEKICLYSYCVCLQRISAIGHQCLIDQFHSAAEVGGVSTSTLGFRSLGQSNWCFGFVVERVAAVVISPSQKQSSLEIPFESAAADAHVAHFTNQLGFLV